MQGLRQSSNNSRLQRGFALIEALVALLVVSFGLLAIASFQYTLSRSSDVAKQRSEATRIAQAEMDRLRSFGQRQSDGNPTDTRYTYVDDVVTRSAWTVPGVTTNTTYTMSRTVTVPSPAPSSGDRFRWVNIAVSWVDRANQTQQVALNSVISDGDPGDLGVLGVRRRPGTTLRPKNRNINIPYPAVNVASCPTGSCSAFVAPPGNVAYVFDNVTGNVVQSCELSAYPISSLTRSGTTATGNAAGHPFTTGTWVTVSGVTPLGYNGNFRLASVNSPSAGDFTYPLAANPGSSGSGAGMSIRRALTEGIDLAALGDVTCSNYSTPAYLLSGYVRFFTGSNPSADDIINPAGNTFDLLSTGPLTITAVGGQPAPSAYSCTAQRQKVVETPNVRAETISGYVRSGNVVTITTAANHSYVVGSVVAISRTADYTLQGRFEIASTPTSRTFTYLEVGPDATDNTGRVELIQQLVLAETDPVPSAYNQVISTFTAYTCVVTPSNTGTPREWWGRLDLVPETAGSPRVPWSTSTYRVCRYSADYNGNGLSNSDHPRNYRRVTGALDSQNFVVIQSGSNCPTDTAPTYTGNQAGDFHNTNTAPHQPTPSYSTSEPNDATTPIAMQ
jgi:type IV pilus modification protein PilV